MEINYCVKCHSRVSSNEVENGDGLVTAENKVYCKQCVIDLGLVPEPAKGAQAARQTKGSGAAVPATARRSDHARPPVTGPAHSGAPARAASRMPMILIGLLGMAALLILAIIVLLLMQKPAAQPSQPQSAPQASATVQPTPPQPVTTPANPVVPVAQPAGQSRPAAPVAVPTATPAGLPATPAPAPGPGTEMLGADWQQRFEAVKGAWAWGPAGLAGTVGGDDGPGIMRSKIEWEHHEGTLSFAVSAAATLECQIRLRDDLRGSILISDIKPGGWHSLAWRVAGVKLLSLTYDGRDILAAPPATIRCRVDGMASIGKVLLRFKPDGPEPMQAVLGSFTVKSLTFEDVAAAFPPLPDCAAVPGNLVPGGGFDQAFNHKFQGWSAIDAAGTAAFRDPFIRHGGTASVRIEDCHLSNSASNSRLWMNNIPVQPNTVYRVSFWARTEKAEFASIGIEIIKNGDGLANFSNIPKTTEWRECTFTFNAGTGGTVNLVLGVWNGKTGRTWFDDVVVVPADAAAAPVPGAGAPAGWTNFMAGNSIEEAGWKHVLANAGYAQTFEWRNGGLYKPVGAKRGQVVRTVPWANGELTFDYDFTAGGVWTLQVNVPGNGALDIGFNGPIKGKHSCRVVLNGTTVTVELDGKPAPNPGLPITGRLTGPATGGFQLYIDVPNDTTVAVTNMRAQAAAGN